MLLRTITRLTASLLKMNPEFTYLFFRREGRELLGRNYRNLWVLISIFFLTFIAIGFSNGSLLYLSIKMEDPFINWVSIPLTKDTETEIKDIAETLSHPDVKQAFNYSDVSTYARFDLFFLDQKRKGFYRKMGRTVGYDNPLIESIFDPKNFLRGRKYYSEHELGLILTEAFVKDLHYPEKTSHVFMKIRYGNDDTRNIAVPVIAVVRELPDLCSFAVTPYFYCLKNDPPDMILPFSPSHTKQLMYFVPGKLADATLFAEKINKFFAQNQQYKKYDPKAVPIKMDSTSYIKGYEICYSFYPEPDSVVFIDQLKREIELSTLLEKSQQVPLHHVRNDYMNYELTRVDNLSVNFITLGKIRDFKTYLFETQKINIDMAQVEAKENYNFVTKLTFVISIILLIFSVISVTVFLSNVLKNHLQKIKMNIGTFKAFGLNDLLLKKIYLSICALFITGSMIISLGISWAFGASGSIRGILVLLKVNLEENQSYFSLFDLWTVVSVAAIILISLFVLNKTMHSIFRHQPGDLIYDRERD